MKRANSREGIVLPATVMALALVGLLLTGGHFLTGPRTRSGDSPLGAGAAVHAPGSRPPGSTGPLKIMGFEPRAALTTIGELELGGSARVDGQNSTPPGWTNLCGEPGPNKPGILIDDASKISLAGEAHALQGFPPVAEDSRLTSDSLLAFGDHGWADLVALADLRFPGGATVTRTDPDSILIFGSWECHTAHKLNWGDPASPGGLCGNHFPIIYASGDLRIEGNHRGQGILLVEGNLTVTGGFEFYGPVIVRGTITTRETGGRFVGGLIAANVSLDQSTVLGDAAVTYSSCAVERAVESSSLSRDRPLPSSGWMEFPPAAGD